jgi:hypothetical protein
MREQAVAEPTEIRDWCGRNGGLIEAITVTATDVHEFGRHTATLEWHSDLCGAVRCASNVTACLGTRRR